jgi:branched-chain amino acid transport system permease protein
VLTGAVAGIGQAGVYAAIAVCLTLMARLVRVVNFAQVIIGGMSAYCASVLHAHGLPYAAGALAGLLIAAALSAALGWGMARWFAEAGTDRRSAVTIVAFVLLLSVSYLLFGSYPRQFPSLLPGSAFRVGGVEVTGAAIAVVAVAIAVASASKAVLGHTRLGLRLRALSERPVTAELAGIRSTPLTIGVWVATSLTVAVVVLLAAPTTVNDQASLGLLVVPGCAAALVGAFRSLGLALLGGLALGVGEGMLAQTTAVGHYRDLVPFGVILAVLIWSQRKEVWDEAR